MHEFKDPTRLTTAAVGAVCAYMVIRPLFVISMWWELSSPPLLEPEQLPASAVVGLVMSLIAIACFILVGCWIYRASANAHTLSSEMTISPGWAVGSYFIPILNLFRPFQGMKEAWLASHFRGNWHDQAAPGLLILWWTLWLGVGFLDNIAWRLVTDSEVPTEASVWFDGVIALINIPLCLVLITMMRRLSRAQLAARHEEVFA